jgi:hypothetical protein
LVSGKTGVSKALVRSFGSNQHQARRITRIPNQKF